VSLRVAIDPGHGGRDPGAVGYIREIDACYPAAQFLAQELIQRQHEAWFTHSPPLQGQKMPLAARYNAANAMQADLYVSLHCNAAESEEALGFEVWTSPGDTESDEYAEAILTTVSGVHVRVDRSDGDMDKEAAFAVLTGTHMPAVLVELGFVTNRQEAQLLRNRNYLRKLAAKVALAIDLHTIRG
jgi:N-acetylmuramoyl-L-alanine amidase